MSARIGEHELGRCAAGPGGDGGQTVILHDPAPPQRAPCLGDDAVFRVHLTQGALLPGGMEFHLVECRRNPCLANDTFQMIGQEVGHRDALCPALLLKAHQSAPTVRIQATGWKRPMDHVYVHIVQSQGFQAFVKGGQCLVITMACVPQLGGDLHLIARQSAFQNAASRPLLVAVDRCGIERAIAHLHRLTHDGRHITILDIHHAQSDEGKRYPIVEPYRPRHLILLRDPGSWSNLQNVALLLPAATVRDIPF